MKCINEEMNAKLCVTRSQYTSLVWWYRTEEIERSHKYNPTPSFHIFDPKLRLDNYQRFCVNTPLAPLPAAAGYSGKLRLTQNHRVIYAKQSDKIPLLGDDLSRRSTSKQTHIYTIWLWFCICVCVCFEFGLMSSNIKSVYVRLIFITRK